MPSKEERYLAGVIIVCSVILISACAYIYTTTPQKGYFELSLTGSNGTILPPEQSITVSQSNILILQAGNTNNDSHNLRVNVELLSLDSALYLLDTTPVTSYTFIIEGEGNWTRSISYTVNSIENDTLKISIDNHEVTLEEYAQNLLFQLKFSLTTYDNTAKDFIPTTVWVSSPFFNIHLDDISEQEPEYTHPDGNST